MQHEKSCNSRQAKKKRSSETRIFFFLFLLLLLVTQNLNCALAPWIHDELPFIFVLFRSFYGAAPVIHPPPFHRVAVTQRSTYKKKKKKESNVCRNVLQQTFSVSSTYTSPSTGLQKTFRTSPESMEKRKDNDNQFLKIALNTRTDANIIIIWCIMDLFYLLFFFFCGRVSWRVFLYREWI